MSNVAITCMGSIGASMGFPLMLWAQAVHGYSPTESALLMLPMAAMSILLAKPVGDLTDQVHPRVVTGFGFAVSLIGFALLTWRIDADTAVWEVAVPMAIIGIGNACIWAPTAATANRNLPLRLAGAGAGVYNATRQVGSVLGAAAIAVLMDARLSAHGLAGGGSPEGGATQLPSFLQAPFAESMQQAMYLPLAMYAVGLVAVLFYEAPRHAGYRAAATPDPAGAAATGVS